VTPQNSLKKRVKYHTQLLSLGTLGNAFAFPRAGNPLGFPSMKHLSFFFRERFFFLPKKEKGFKERGSG